MDTRLLELSAILVFVNPAVRALIDPEKLSKVVIFPKFLTFE
jgi:hypothetical protein